MRQYAQFLYWPTIICMRTVL